MTQRPAPTGLSPVLALCDAHVERAAARHPVYATYDGIPGYDDQPTDYSPAGHGARADLLRDTLRSLEGLPCETAADQLAASVLTERLTTALALHDAGELLRVMNPFGPLTEVRGNVDLLPTATVEDWQSVVARLGQAGQMLAGQRESLLAGLTGGPAVAARQVRAAIEQTAVWAGMRGAPPAHLPLVATAPEQLRDRVEQAATSAHAAYAETSSWLAEVYLPQAAQVDGVGPERHALWSREALGADVDPLEAYAWGWEELRRIEDEMAREGDRVRPGATVPEAVALLDASEALPTSQAYLGWLQERHDRALADLDGVDFDIDPRLKVIEVRLAPPGSASAPYYTGPSEDLTRPGRTWWPTGERTSFTTWDDVTTVAHEGVPGHHLQLGAAKIAPLSRFSRNAFVSGHGEGWALYAERLADELGWFETPGQRLGMLLGSALRAARVVIDIGIHLRLPLPPAEAARHGERWTFDVALEVFRERGRQPSHMAVSEITRYFGWPGQAPSYKLGERAWLTARAETERRLGASFDRKAWHTAALDLGPMGLDTLAEQLGAWTPAR